MSDEVVLTPTTRFAGSLEAESVVPDRFAALAEREIAALPVWQGGTRAALGDFFAVRGGRAARVRIAGGAARVDGLGAGMTAGTLLIDGDAGRALGRGMTGGSIEVAGDAGDFVGVAMAGGVIVVRGDVGDGVGAAPPGASRGMTGGEIVVHGSAGRNAGATARRGLVVIAGHAADGAARAMIAGTVVVLGDASRGAAEGAKRGTLIAAGAVTVPPTFRYACTYAPPHVRLLLTYLRARYTLPVADGLIAGRFRRYSGDMAELGRGEILHWTGT